MAISRSNLGGPKVLLVEDDQSVSRMLRLSLRSAGFEVTAVSTGVDALRALDAEPVDAVVLDLGLPDRRGGAVLDRLKSEGRSEDESPAWVVISALDQGEATRQYGPLGRHFVAKPFDPWDLVNLLRGLRT